MWCFQFACSCTVWKDVKLNMTTWCAENKLKLLQRARSNEKLHCCSQANSWFGLCAISKITLLSFLGSYIWFTTHNSVNCGCNTCRGSPRGPTSGSVSGSRGVCSSKQLQRIVGQSSADPTVLLPEVDQTSQTEFRFFIFSLSFAGISGFWDQTLLLTGGPSRRAAVTTAPAPGPEGNTLFVASLSWQILKTWLSSLAVFVLYLCTIFWW